MDFETSYQIKLNETYKSGILGFGQIICIDLGTCHRTSQFPFLAQETVSSWSRIGGFCVSNLELRVEARVAMVVWRDLVTEQ